MSKPFLKCLLTIADNTRWRCRGKMSPWVTYGRLLVEHTVPQVRMDGWVLRSSTSLLRPSKCSTNATTDGIKQFLQSRQVNIPKAGQCSDAHQLDVKNLRPISIMSIFWRIYSSSWARSIPLQQWSKRALHHEVCHGKGAQGAEDLADAMQQLLVHRKGYLASIDLSQAFDHMNP